MTAATSETVIEVCGLTKRYGSRIVVDRIDMRVARGRIFGFLGPNGSGKTTTIRMLCGLLTPDEGEGQCLGYDIRRQSRLIKRAVGYMTQSFGLYLDLSIEENLDFIARVYEVPERTRRIAELLEKMGLAQRRTQLAGALSGGWKQRLALAACLLHEPKLLLLDEPTAGVDPQARREFWDQLHDLAAEGLTVLVSTHYMDEAERCNELAYISSGRLLAQGTPQQLIDDAHLATCEISGAGLAPLARLLRSHPAVRSVAFFGNVLHVSAASAAQLDEALATFRGHDIAVHRVNASLEDVFIALMRNDGGQRTGASP
ncbi:ABC-2 type transport system ATP-binding protein [Paucimonas lemoignei]|uniref:ABC-2 type transport system ATP-binding protein n=1 Tax=Paucimonas lemoignei TaxID=29443 RepID=A0A4R3I0N5_PAULE|nr:ABC transporter ATP-binding protein [Paucimonas lemoignei]TCS38543.1 ABC-2 type transport system ATP-binding protein [Paucimonas lemoignei]